MSSPPRRYVFLGLSITSTWGNGHATTYRGLLKHLAARGHSVVFLERDVPWYAANREFSTLPYCEVGLYGSLEELHARFGKTVSGADAVVVGSYVPEGDAVGRWAQAHARGVAAFYDIDTPVTLSALERDECEYLRRDQVSQYDLYLSFTGGPLLEFIERHLGSPCARALYCSVDPGSYFPDECACSWEMAYLGTYAADRQPAVESLLLGAARQMPQSRFALAGPQYPADIEWPANVARIEHLPATAHREFYNSQRFTLNVTRRDMIRAGYSPSVRLFEAAACGVPILTDEWPGLGDFFEPGQEIVPVRNTEDVLRELRMPEEQRLTIAERARCRALRFHTASVRAAQFEQYVHALLTRSRLSNKGRPRAVAKTAAALLER